MIKPRVGCYAVYEPPEEGWQNWQQQLQQVSDELQALGLDVVLAPEAVMDLESMERVADYFEGQRLDVLHALIICWSFDHYTVEIQQRIGVPLIIRAIPGIRTGSMVGSMQLASVLADIEVPYRLLYGEIGDPAQPQAAQTYALACAIMMVGSSFNDAVDHLIWVQYGLAERDDLAVAFTEPSSGRALFELAALPGVERVEGYRSVPVRMRFGHRTYRTEIRGVSPGGELFRVLDATLRPVRLPSHGLVLTDYLADLLGVRPGQELTVEVLEAGRPVRQMPVVGLVSQYLGVSGYMNLDALNRLLGQGDAVSGAWLAVDRSAQAEVHGRLEERPRVAGTVIKRNAVKGYMESMERQVLVMAFFNTLLAGAIAFGVVYNSARIALAERGRELASLRVLGYTRGEISYILLGELALLTLMAIPLGFVIGRGLCALLYRGLQTDLYRIPLVLTPGTLALAATVVLASAAVSALVVRRRLDRLDLVKVLKSKE